MGPTWAILFLIICGTGESRSKGSKEQKSSRDGIKMGDSFLIRGTGEFFLAKDQKSRSQTGMGSRWAILFLYVGQGVS